MRPIDYLDRWAALRPDCAALVDEEGRRWTYRDLQRDSWTLAKGLWAQGIRETHRVAIYARNHPSVLICILAAMRAGTAWLLVNPNDGIASNITFMRSAEVSWLFYHSEFGQARVALQKSMSEFLGGACLDEPKDHAMTLEQLAAAAGAVAELHWADPWGNSSSIAWIRQTGGSTGRPKTVLIPTASWAANMATFRSCLDLEQDTTVCLNAAPLTACGTITQAVYTAGGCNIILSRFDPREIVRRISADKVTHLWMSPTGLYSLLATPTCKEGDFSSLRALVIGGAFTAPEKLKEAVKVFGPCVTLGFGQTQSGPATWLSAKTLAEAAGGHHAERLESCGVACPTVVVAVMNDDGELLPSGSEGELVVRSRSVCAGYLNDDAETSAMQRFGWHHTNDRALVDNEGFVYLRGRVGDLINTGSFKVYPAEVESVIHELEGVTDCAVVGQPHPYWVEMVVAVITVADQCALSKKHVMEHCLERLGKRKAPKRIEIWGELPRTPVGKIDKGAIVRRLSSVSAPKLDVPNAPA